MSVFRSLTSRIVPLPGTNIDTDQIIPASYLKVTDKKGLAKGLFANWRYDENHQPREDFVLNQADYRQAKILLVGDNFGCGSSREHAAWALQDHGFEVVIGTSFADIFQTNSAKNGLLTASVEEDDHASLMRMAQERPTTEIKVDLQDRLISSPEIGSIPFQIDPFVRHCLLNGIDELGYLLDQMSQIEAYETRHPQRVQTIAAATAEE